MYKEDNENFQTPDWVCEYMVSLIPITVKNVLEPAPGKGNLINAILKKGLNCSYPTGDFWKSNFVNGFFDSIVMNPPFSPATEGYKFLNFSMQHTNFIIALMPWWTIINSQKRTREILDFGLVSITHLPRYAFPGSRIQTCILNLERHYSGFTKFIFLER